MRMFAVDAPAGFALGSLSMDIAVPSSEQIILDPTASLVVVHSMANECGSPPMLAMMRAAALALLFGLADHIGIAWQ